MRVGIIGIGQISKNHIVVLKQIGHEIVAIRCSRILWMYWLRRTRRLNPGSCFPMDRRRLQSKEQRRSRNQYGQEVFSVTVEEQQQNDADQQQISVVDFRDE